MKFSFISKRPTFESSVGGYAFPNENMNMHRFLCTKLPAATWSMGEKVGCICSGGEFPLTVLLPQHQGKVIAVDHSLNSIMHAMVKALLIEKHGTQLTAHLESAAWTTLHPEILELSAQLPAEVKAMFDKKFAQNGSCSEGRVFNAKGFNTYYRPYYKSLSSWDLQCIQTRLPNLTFMHGDLRDLAGENLSFLYASNAPGHTAHDGKNPSNNEFLPCLKADGYILSTDFRSSHDGCKLIDFVPSGTARYFASMSWDASWEARVFQKETKAS